MPDRQTLHFGPYNAPRFRVREHVECQAGGDVRIVGITDARIGNSKGSFCKA